MKYLEFPDASGKHISGLSSDLKARLSAAGLDTKYVEHSVGITLAEDLAGGVDVTTVAIVPTDTWAVVDFVARAEGVVAGLPIVHAVLEAATEGTAVVEHLVTDGSRVSPQEVLLSVAAPARVLLSAERAALNLLCHLSGIATLTRQWTDAIAGTNAQIRDTRKTTPGLRALEKYAVRCGGGVNHRMSLSDAALVKDNHVLVAGGVATAFQAVRAIFPDVPVEVEVDRLDQIKEILEAGADLILLDNMTIEEIRKAVKLVAGRARLEASGGLTLQSARQIAETGVDYLAVGALTHSAPILDIGCDMQDKPNLRAS